MMLRLVLSIIFATEFTMAYKIKHDNNICQSKECVKTASNILFSMDQSVDPCDDFFKYACGNWAKYNPTSDSLSWSSVRVKEQGIINRKLKDMLNSDNVKGDPLPLNQAKDYYKACINLTSNGMKTIVELLEKVDVPLTPSFFKKPKTQHIKFDWLNTVIKLKKRISMDLLIGFDIYYKRKLNITFIEFFQYNISDIEDEDRVLLKKSVFEILKSTKIENIKDKIENSIDEYFEYQKIIISSLNTTITKEHGKFYSIDKLQNLTDQNLQRLNLTKIEIWKPFILRMFNKSAIEFDFHNDKVFVTHGDFENLMTILSIVQNTTSTKLELYIWFEIISKLIHLATPELTKLYCKAYKNSRCTQTKEYCTLSTITEMGLAVIYGMLDEDSSKISKKMAETALRNIEKAYAKSVNATPWIKSDYKDKINYKLMSTEEFIAFPNWLFTSGSLENYYKGLKISPDNYLKSKFALEKWRLDKKIADYSKPFKYDWNMVSTIHSLNGHFNFYYNSMVIKTFMLDFPYYNLGLDSLNYAGLGYIMGHELMHSFDDEVAKIKIYDNATECIKEQYSKIYIAKIDKYADGEKSLFENIADIGGLKHAFIAYQNTKKVEMTLPGLANLNENKLFFLWFAHNWCHTDTEAYYSSKNNKEHSPGIVRIIGTLQNIPQFSEVWHCPVGSKMNPKEKCTLI